MTGRHAMRWDPALADLLDAPERERDMPAGHVVALLNLRDGETVVDYGAGTGRLALAVAERLAGGHVIAAESSPEMFELLSGRLAAVENAQALFAPAGRTGLPDASAQRILAVDVLHHMKPEHVQELRRLLAPDGMLLLIDWQPDGEREHGPPPEELLTPQQAFEELVAAGFQPQHLDAPFAHRYTIAATAAPRGTES